MSLSKRVVPYDAADQLMRDDLRHYCRKLVRIGTKRPGEIVPFIWNRAQEQLHAKLERQRDARGLVRALVLKARRMGISTYVGARFYHRSTLRRGHRAFILTHEDKATQALFDMVRRMHNNMPRDYRHDLLAANENELDFAGTESGYRVGTAKNTAGLGRAQTLQLLHGSEVAFWAHAEKHFGGLVQALSLVEGTEGVLESTANGVGGTFYKQWGLAEKGQSDFIPIFLPWMIDPDNVRPLTSDYEPSSEEETYQRLYKLTDEQLCWLHYKNIELGGEPGAIGSMFRQEYPAIAAEAFQTTGTDSFIANELILRARRLQLPAQRFLPRVLGIDSARSIGETGDDTRIIDRQGRRAGIEVNIRLRTNDETKIAHEVMKLLRDHPDIRKAFFDVTGGYGAGAHDICKANGFEDRVAAINFGAGAQEENEYANRRVEMWHRVRDWLMDPGGAQIGDDDVAQRHLSAPWLLTPDGNSRKRLAPKEQIKAKLGFSPDWGDALALTFAEILSIDEPNHHPKWMCDLEDDEASNTDFMSR